MLKILTFLMIVSAPTHAVYHHAGLILSVVTAIASSILTMVIYDFFRLTKGTFKWRWRSFDFKSEFTNAYMWHEVCYLAVVSWFCVVFGERIAHWLSI